MGSVQVQIQALSTINFARHKIYISPDPAWEIRNTTPFMLEGKIKRVSFGVNEELCTCEIEFPSRPFGSHINFMTPIMIYLDNVNNPIFRGFMIEEEGTLSDNSDQIKTIVYDYKWLMGKLTKIRGKLYTINNHIKPDAGSFISAGRVFTDRSLYEKFRYRVPMDADAQGYTVAKDATGYIGHMKTIFNQNGNPDCATPDVKGPLAKAFKFDPDQYYFGTVRERQDIMNNFYYWNYATMIHYCFYNYIENLLGNACALFFDAWNLGVSTSKWTYIKLNMTGLYNIMRFGEVYGMEYIEPMHYDITGLSPIQAIDKIIKSIPGNWYWRISHYPEFELLDIGNHSDPMFRRPGKSIYVGNTGKIANITNNQVNAKSVVAKRSIKDAVSHAVAVGGPVEIETTIQYMPSWEQYIRPTSDLEDEAVISYDDQNYEIYEGFPLETGTYLANFKNPHDFDNWVKYTNRILEDKDTASKKFKEGLNSGDEIRYSRIFRAYELPTSKRNLVQFDDFDLGRFSDIFSGYADVVSELIFSHVLVPRKILPPLTDYKNEYTYKDPIIVDRSFKYNKKGVKILRNSNNPLFVFLWDKELSEVLEVETGGALPETVESMLISKRWIVPGADNTDGDKDLNYSFDDDNRIVMFAKPQFCRKTVSFTMFNEEESFPIFASASARRVFVTGRIQCDTPIVYDQQRSKYQQDTYYGNARLVTQDINETASYVIRYNAYFPVLEGENGNNIIFEPDDLGSGKIVKVTENLASDSKLVDWNKRDFESSEPFVVIDDINQLKQMVEILIGQAPIYYESFEVDVGRIDASYEVGDRVVKIVNSELANGSGGYYGLNALIEKIEIESLGDNDAYTMKLSIRNNIPPTQHQLEERRQ
jgi:hypothetical protein